MSLATQSTPPSRSLAGKVAIVTGAGCAGDGIGNGRAISILLANDGCNVVCVDQNPEWAQRTVDMINSEPGYGKAILAQADVTSASDCEAVVTEALDTFGRVDILVNNVGVAGAPGTAVDVVSQRDSSESIESCTLTFRSGHGEMGERIRDQCFQYGADGEICCSGNDEE